MGQVCSNQTQDLSSVGTLTTGAPRLTVYDSCLLLTTQPLAKALHDNAYAPLKMNDVSIKSSSVLGGDLKFRLPLYRLRNWP